jgi:hypothetical protein
MLPHDLSAGGVSWSHSLKQEGSRTSTAMASICAATTLAGCWQGGGHGSEQDVVQVVNSIPRQHDAPSIASTAPQHMSCDRPAQLQQDQRIRSHDMCMLGAGR